MKKITTIAIFLLGGIFININAQGYNQIIKNYFGQRISASSDKAAAYKDWEIKNIDPSESLKATVINIQQKINGVPVMFSDAVIVIRDNTVVSENSNFIPVTSEYLALSPKPGLSSENALARAGKSILTSLKQSQNKDGRGDSQLVFYPINKTLVLAYVYIYQDKDLEKILVVNANTGETLRDDVTTLSCSFREDSFYSSDGLGGVPAPRNTYSGVIMAPPAGPSYNVLPLPTESPNFGTRSIISNPALDSSPIGWHNDGANTYNTTRGNNVYAYDDSGATNSPGNSPLATDLAFNYPLDLNESASKYKDAAITNLFYTNNMAHDLFYKFGFTETAKNFQATNFDKGGSGGDYVRAEAQDGGGLDNANFSPAFEGASYSYPRMQMYLWSPKLIQNIYIQTPVEFSGREIPSRLASFGPALSAAKVTGSLTLSQPIDGCTDLGNAGQIAGNIAFIERGNCNYVAKVKNAQNAGAKAVVIYNPTTASSFGQMGGSDSSITIPSILIKKEDGDFLKDLISKQTVNVSLEDDKSKYKYIDGSLDNGIVIHEYGHGVTNRMTGTGYSCLDKTKSAEQMGEGWSDYFAMIFTYRLGDTPNNPRGIGTFAAAQSGSDLGIRPAKYSPDFAINNYTYGKTNAMTYKDANNVEQIDVHSIGFVYATILWDMTAKMVAKYGNGQDVLQNPTGGYAKSLQLVMDALKLQGCNPSFIDGRDAIIRADKLANNGDNECLIWDAFARRGLGEKASAGDKSNIKDQVEDFTIPQKCLAVLATDQVSGQKKQGAVLFPNPAADQVYIKTGPVQGRMIVSIYDMSGSLVSKSSIKAGEPISVNALQNGIYTLNVEGIEFKTSQKLTVKHK